MTSYSVNGYELRSPSGKSYEGGASYADAVARRHVLRLPAETEIVDLDTEVDAETVNDSE